MNAINGCEDFKISKEQLPLLASEDVGEFLDLNKKGCFFMLGTKKGEKNFYLHQSDHDFNDQAIKYGILSFCRILDYRLNQINQLNW